MDEFKVGERVMVSLVGDGDEPTELPEKKPGTVRRIRTNDGGAWVHMDDRLGGEYEKLHPFPANDPTRATSVLTYPEYCELLP